MTFETVEPRYAAHHAPKARGSMLRLGLIGLVALVLTWQVIHTSLSAYLGQAAPEVALAFRSDNAPALLEKADQALNAAWLRQVAEAAETEGAEPPERPNVTPEAARRIATWTRTALEAEPLNPRGLRILGQLHEAAGNTTETARMMTLAADLSIRESFALFWLLRQDVEAERFDRALHLASATMSTGSDIGRHVARYLVSNIAVLANAPGGIKALVEIIRENPNWRSRLLRALPSYVTDLRTPLEILLALKEAGLNLKATELENYIALLMRHRQYQLAYYTWLQFLPPEAIARVRFPYNGGFETEPGGLSFDWQIKPADGAFTEIVALPGTRGERALFVEFTGARVEYQHTQQMLLLAAGRYELTGRVRADLKAERGLAWRVYCAGKNERLATSPPVIETGGAWQDFALAFEVPAGCPAQVLRLESTARFASEAKVSGEVWYDDVRVGREDGLVRTSE